MKAWLTEIRAVHPLTKLVTAYKGDTVFADTRHEAWEVLKTSGRAYMKVIGESYEAPRRVMHLVNPN